MSDNEILQERTENYLKSLMVDTAKVADDIDAMSPFAEIGIDSFHALKVVKRLEDDFGSLSKTLLFENFNIHDLAKYFVSKHKTVLDKLFGESSKGKTTPLAPGNDEKENAASLAESEKQQGDSKPVLLMESDLALYPDISSVVTTLYEEHKNESSVSRGTRNIAPNLFVGAQRKGYFHYSRSRNVLLAYGYTGEMDYFPKIVEELYSHCKDRNLELNLFFGEDLDRIGNVEITSTPFGLTQVVDNLQKFSLKGSKMRRLRYQVSKFEKAGECYTREYTEFDENTAKNIAGVIDAWCDLKTMVNPLILKVKDEILEGTLNSEHRLFLTYFDDVLQNVILISPLCKKLNGYLMDLEFYPKDMPLGGLEYAIVNIADVLIKEGCDQLSLGGTYGCKLGDAANADEKVDKILDGLREQGVFNDEGNYQFKNKFRTVNTPIYLCRPTGMCDPENVLDVIMMIADPDKMQTSDAENHTFVGGNSNTESSVKTDEKTASISPVVPMSENKPQEFDEGELIGAKEHPRYALLHNAGFNPLNIPFKNIEFDLKTDSWAQITSPVIEKQVSQLNASLHRRVSVEQALRNIFPFDYFAITDSGRSAERAFYRAFSPKKTILQNIVFPTALYHQLNNGYTPVEIPHPAIFNTSAADLQKGGIDVDLLASKLEDPENSIKLVCIELANNAAGGTPVFLSELEKVKSLLKSKKIPLVLDGTRIIDSAILLQESDPSAKGKSIWEIIKAACQYADYFTASLPKNFCVKKGGIVASNNGDFIRQVSELVMEDGTGIDIVHKKHIGQALQNQKKIEVLAQQRLNNVAGLTDKLVANGLPLVPSMGGHCVLLDVARLDAFKGHADPVASYLASLYWNTGIRAAGHNVGMQKDSSLNSLVRFAVPLGMTEQNLEEINSRLIRFHSSIVNIPYLRLGEQKGTESTFVLEQIEKESNISYLGKQENVTPLSQFTEQSDGASKAKSQETTKAMVADKNYVNDDIAIVGLAGRYPKAKTMDDLWENLLNGVDCITDLPDYRYKMRRSSPFSSKYRGGFIDDIDKFDSLFFNISPREAETVDPQERLFLEVAWELLEDSGYYPETLEGDSEERNIGVFVGAVWTTYQTVGAEERLAGNESVTNSFLWSVANRISYYMNFSGPSIAIDTACSASLTALHLACESVKKGECTSAVVGGVNLDVHQCKQEITVAGGLLSEDGYCRAFGEGASGYVPGEGVGAVLIKPLSKAVADKDNIYGVIRGIGINHGGRTSGYSVPNPKAQTSLISSVIRNANIDAKSIGYIEAHGTGTELGDPIEISGLNDAFEPYQLEAASCPVGSIKTNIGHLEAAAGLVGVTKALLQIKNKMLVPSLHSSTLNEFIDFNNSPFYIQQKAEPWTNKEIAGKQTPLRAGISSFGAGGSNAHVIVEEYIHSSGEDTAQQGTPLKVFPLSARTEDQLKDMAARLLLHLEKSPNIDLRDVAFTLAIGRKSLTHRVAIFADTHAELCARLGSFVVGQKEENLVTGNVKSSEGLSTILSRKEKEEFVSLITKSGDDHRVAQIWVDGLLPDWQGYKNTCAGRRISLPTYPFADKRHWGAELNDRVELSLGAGNAARYHPLVDSNESTFETQLYKKTFVDSEFFIFDHLVSDIPTLPGVAYLDLARKAGELAAGCKVAKIRNIVWVSPLTVENSVPNEAYIRLTPNGELVNFEVFSNRDDGREQLYSQGKLEFSVEGQEETTDEYIDLDGIKSRVNKVISGDEAYPLFKSLGLGLGPSFQVLQDIYKNDKEVLGELSIPDIENSDISEFVIHPSLMDGSFQAAMAAKLRSETSGDMLVPYSLGEVEVIHPLTKKCYSYVTEGDDANKRGSNLTRMNVTIVDENGRVLVKVKDSVGVPLVSVHEKDEEHGEPFAAQDEFSKLHYSTVWDESVYDLSKSKQKQVPTLVFSNNASLREKFATETSKGNTIFVESGKDFSQQSENLFSIQRTEKEQYLKVFEEFEAKGLIPEHICFAWPIDSSVQFEEEQDVSNALNDGVYSFLLLCQVIVEKKLEAKVCLQYVYARDPETPDPAHDAINGFIGILRAESPRLNVRSITIDMSTNNISEEHVKCLTSELDPARSDEAFVRYHDERRSTRRISILDEVFEENTQARLPQIKQNGVYIITGGAGGLGLIFAESLAKSYQAKLVLSGRSKPSEKVESNLERLRELGAEVTYVQADVSSESGVKDLISSAKTSYGAINGIIHSAGVLRDAYIRNKTFEEMDAVFLPKIHGTLLLDEYTKDEHLDFFVMFSSLAALSGNAGQGDYAFANHFMDSFSEARDLQRQKGLRSGKTLSINWSLWADGGMRLDEQTEAFFRNSLGIKPLESATGIDALHYGLAGNIPNFAIIEGVQEKIERAWGLIADESEDETQDEVVVLPEGGDELLEAVQEKVSVLVMDFLKVDEDDINLDTILVDLGFDSIGLATFANNINDIYDLDVTPVLFFEYPNIREISKYIAIDNHSVAQEVHSDGITSAAPAAATTVSATNTETTSSAVENKKLNKKGWKPSSVANSETKQSFSADQRFAQMPIAIVGASGVMPQSDNLDEYWEKLRDAENNMVTLIPEDRWSWEEYYGDPREEENKTLAKWGGFMREVDKFDPLFWGISPREAEMMDPQQRVFLETVWGAIEDSGHKVSDLAGTKTGLFVGAATRDYIDLMAAENAELDGYSASGTSHAVLANRVSFMLDIHGPSAPLDTACSSSLVALHRAIESIHTGSSEMAIVGGVQVMLTAAGHISFGAAGMLASDGKCKTFDERGDGYVRGEGSGAILIKPLNKAEEDNDHIYAVIRATAENHGGKATMLTAPNPNAQADLLVEAYEKAQIDPGTVGLIECHGTGTSLGDPIEVKSMKKAFAELYKRHGKPDPSVPHIGLTSAKTNIGHLETAAGIAGILKVILAMKHRQIPALLHFETQNPYIDLNKTPFYMVDKTIPWEPAKDQAGKSLPLRAGISSFGFGGANVHVVLEEYQRKQSEYVEGSVPKFFVLSAKNEERAHAYVSLIKTFYETNDVDLNELLYTLQVGRDEMEYRVAFEVTDNEQFLDALDSYVAKAEANTEIYAGKVAKKTASIGISQDEINSWLANKDTKELINAWVKGCKIDWSALYTNIKKPNRISLPTYPFARERYWFTSLGVPENLSSAAAIHPLVHRNNSNLYQTQYLTAIDRTSELTKNYVPAINVTSLREHSADADSQLTQKHVAMSIYPEMVRATAVHALDLSGSDEQQVKLSNLEWGKHCEFVDGKEFSIDVHDLEDDRIEIEISSESDNEEFDLHFSCEVEICNERENPALDLAVIQNQFDREHADVTSKVLNAVNADTSEQGSSTKAIQSIYSNADQWFVKIDTEEFKGEGDERIVLQNGIVNLVANLAVAFGCGVAYQNIIEQMPKFGDLSFSADLHNAEYMWLRKSRQGGVDVDLLDQNGQIKLKCVNIVSDGHSNKTRDEFSSIINQIFNSEDVSEEESKRAFINILENV